MWVRGEMDALLHGDQPLDHFENGARSVGAAHGPVVEGFPRVFGQTVVSRTPTRSGQQVAVVGGRRNEGQDLPGRRLDGHDGAPFAFHQLLGVALQVGVEGQGHILHLSPEASPCRSVCFARCFGRPPGGGECPACRAGRTQTGLPRRICPCSPPAGNGNRGSCLRGPPRGTRRQFGSRCRKRFRARAWCGWTVRDTARALRTGPRIPRRSTGAGGVRLCSASSASLWRDVVPVPRGRVGPSLPGQPCRCRPCGAAPPSSRNWARW